MFREHWNELSRIIDKVVVRSILNGRTIDYFDAEIAETKASDQDFAYLINPHIVFGVVRVQLHYGKDVHTLTVTRHLNARDASNDITYEVSRGQAVVKNEYRRFSPEVRLVDAALVKTLAGSVPDTLEDALHNLYGVSSQAQDEEPGVLKDVTFGTLKLRYAQQLDTIGRIRTDTKPHLIERCTTCHQRVPLYVIERDYDAWRQDQQIGFTVHCGKLEVVENHIVETPFP